MSESSNGSKAKTTPKNGKRSGKISGFNTQAKNTAKLTSELNESEPGDSYFLALNEIEDYRIQEDE